MFEILDDNGVIHSGDENEMQHAFSVMVCPENSAPEDVEKYNVDWKGDLKLVQIIRVTR